MSGFVRIIDTAFRLFLGIFACTLVVCFSLNWIGGVKLTEITDVFVSLYIIICAVVLAVMIIVMIVDRDDFKIREIFTTVPVLLLTLVLGSLAIVSALNLYAYYGNLPFDGGAPLVGWYLRRYATIADWISDTSWLTPVRHILARFGLTDVHAVRDIVIAVLGALIAASISAATKLIGEEAAPAASKKGA